MIRKDFNEICKPDIKVQLKDDLKRKHFRIKTDHDHNISDSMFINKFITHIRELCVWDDYNSKDMNHLISALSIAKVKVYFLLTLTTCFMCYFIYN